jgi:hypothetical protein
MAPGNIHQRKPTSFINQTYGGAGFAEDMEPKPRLDSDASTLAHRPQRETAFALTRHDLGPPDVQNASHFFKKY